MPNICFSIVIVHRKLTPEKTGVIGPLRLVLPNSRAILLPHQIQKRHEVRAGFAECLETIHLEANALLGPALPFPLGYFETERVGAFASDTEICFVHWLESDWITPFLEFYAAVESCPHLTFEMIYIEPYQDDCGAMVGLGGNVVGRYCADFAALEAATDLLTPDELAKKPSYLTNYRWFLVLQALRAAGLHDGEIISLGSPGLSEESGAEWLQPSSVNETPF